MSVVVRLVWSNHFYFLDTVPCVTDLIQAHSVKPVKRFIHD